MIGTPLHQLHDEERPAAIRRAGVENLRDIVVVHERQSLTLGLEPRDHQGRVHSRLDDLERDRAMNGFLLLRHEHDTHAAFTNRMQQCVGPDATAWHLGDGSRKQGRGDQAKCRARVVASAARAEAAIGPVEQISRLLVCLQERFHSQT